MATFSFHKKDSTGRYHLRIYDKHKQPKRKERSLGTTRKDVARRKTTELEEAYHAGRWDPWTNTGKPQHLSARATIDAFLDDKEGQVRPRTLDTYDGILSHWERDHCPAGILLKDVQEKHLRPFIFASKTENATKRKRHRHLRAFFNWTVKAGHLQASPLTDALKPRKEEKQQPFLNPDELKRLLRAVDAHADLLKDQPGPNPDDGWLKDMVRVAVSTGLRRGELLVLRWSDVDLTSGYLHVANRGDHTTKGGNERSVPLAGDALDVLTRLDMERSDESDGPVFTDGRGLPIKKDRVSKRFKFFCRKAKLRRREDLHFHCLRHTCGSWLAMKGIPMRVIQQILGHSSVSVTERYSHLQPEVMARAMEETFGS